LKQLEQPRKIKITIKNQLNQKSRRGQKKGMIKTKKELTLGLDRFE
jgi:hypothetical protein